MLLPTQLAYHFWPQYAFVFGIRVDFLAPRIYLTDVLFSVWFFSWFIEKVLLFKRTRLVWKRFLRRAPLFIFLVLFVVLNTFYSKNPEIAFMQWIKVGELFLLAVLVTQEDGFEVKKVFISPLSFSLIIFSSIGLFQFLFQKTLGGPLYFLGERSFSSQTPGIALFDFFGQQRLRAYSTFSHPNSFAGFLLAGGLTVLAFPSFVRNHWRLAALIVFTAAALILSFSRSAWSSLFVIGFLFLTILNPKGKIKNKTLLLVALIVVASFLLAAFGERMVNVGFSKQTNVSERLFLAKTSGVIASKNPAFGVGLNNFIPTLSGFKGQSSVVWQLQPVHNIFLLLFSETGLLGLLLFLFLIKKTVEAVDVEQKSRSLILPLLAIIITGFFDHYWLTLQQNQMLFAFIVGLIFRGTTGRVSSNKNTFRL